MSVLSTALGSAGGDSALGRAGHVVLQQDQFERAICLERKRTERSHRPFLLMLLDVSRVAATGSDTELDRLVRDLVRSIREIDILGWHQDRSVLGIIFTEIRQEFRAAIAGSLLLRVRGILYSSLGFDHFNLITISYHLFPEEWSHDVPQRPSHPSLYPDLSSRATDNKCFDAVKRTLDVIGSSFGLIVLLPLFIVIAIAIKVSSKGPVLFRQVRVGQYGAPFVFLKFRSMHTGNNCRIHREYVRALINGSAERKTLTSRGESVYKLTNDPRVTRVGAFLRKTSLDELPQLYNVLKGEMSLVGPRPAIPYEVQAYASWHRRRVLEAKPGITGLWQVKGRSRVSFDEMVRLDVRYATTRSLLLDIKILFQTPGAVILGAGAC